MSSRKDDDPQFTPVTRVELKRVDAAELVMGDELLRGCALLKSLTDDSMKKLFAVALARRYLPATPVFKQDDGGDSLFLVLKGEVRLTCRKDKEPVEVTVVTRGDVFGEAEVVGHVAQRTVSAHAVGDVDVVEIPRRTLHEVGRAHGAMLAYLKELSEKRKATLDEMSDFLNRW